MKSILHFYCIAAILIACSTSYAIRHIQNDESSFKISSSSSLQLPLYHPSGGGPQEVSPVAVFDSDEARVKFLNFRLSGSKSSNTSGSGSETYVETVGAPVNSGRSIGVGNYYTKIGIGTPASYHLVVIDTGSSFSWIQCQPCAIYCHNQEGTVFEPSASATYRRLSCDSGQCSSLQKATLNNGVCTTSNGCLYTATYGDRSYSIGYLSEDSLAFGGESQPGFVFGCGQDNEGLFGRSAGLLGLAKNELSLISQLSNRYDYAFSYCLPTADNGGGGVLSIGGGSGRDYKFTPMITDSKDPTLYLLKISAITVSGSPLSVGDAYNGRTILDSGTVITRLPPAVYSALRAQLVKIISTKFESIGAYSILDACFSGTFEEVSSVVPPVQIIFNGGADLNLSPRNIIYEVKTGITCLSFAGNSNADEVTIIGNQQQQTFDIVYDIANSRIGFADGGCQ